ncbi:hypothetical protein [Rhizobium leguminosarum]|jgi:hypothetical protein|uniref:hypothetical protein n=1 Tax=Rhizobium leguminosarum TaxID=384 RepID=UPI002E135BC1|nr:hypothetical protein U8Q02_38275 [Rhizobium leguminosarum]
MYHLLVGVIAVALFAALTLTGAFYLGPQFTKATIKAHVTTMVNQAQQISAANTLYNVDEAKSTDSIQELVDLGYLKEVPVRPVVAADSAEWEITLGATAADRSYVHIELGGDAGDQATVCDIVSKLVGACEGSVYNYPL